MNAQSYFRRFTDNDAIGRISATRCRARNSVDDPLSALRRRASSEASSSIPPLFRGLFSVLLGPSIGRFASDSPLSPRRSSQYLLVLRSATIRLVRSLFPGPRPFRRCARPFLYIHPPPSELCETRRSNPCFGSAGGGCSAFGLRERRERGRECRCGVRTLCARLLCVRKTSVHLLSRKPTGASLARGGKWAEGSRPVALCIRANLLSCEASDTPNREASFLRATLPASQSRVIPIAESSIFISALLRLT